MLYARDFRGRARAALKGRWGIAVLVTLVAGLLGGSGIPVPTATMQVAGDGYLNFIDYRALATLMTMSFAAALVVLIIGGVTQMGHCAFYTKLAKGQEAQFTDLFSRFSQIWRGICMQFIMGLFVFLWSLLFVIPGIVAAYRYAMVPYLMSEFPDLRVMDAMRESKRLMMGNKARLFCLHFSFIGWSLLASLTFGIGYLWLNPYMRMAEAEFYLGVTGRIAHDNQGNYQNPDMPNGGNLGGGSDFHEQERSENPWDQKPKDEDYRRGPEF